MYIIKKYTKIKSWEWCLTPAIPEDNEGDALREFEASLDYIVSCSPARATKLDPVLNKTKQTKSIKTNKSPERGGGNVSI